MGELPGRCGLAELRILIAPESATTRVAAFAVQDLAAFVLRLNRVWRILVVGFEICVC